MFYAEPVYRPPSEHASLLVQATVGCSAAAAGRCHFCNSNVFNRQYKQKKFRIRPTAEIIADLRTAKVEYGEGVEKIFLLDSNAMIMSTGDLLQVLQACNYFFPNLRQVSCYACCDDIHRKSPAELESLRAAGLKLVYIGLESGDPTVLKMMNKGVSVERQIEAVLKVKSAGIRSSVSVILGLGGKEHHHSHSINTGKALAAMAPTYAAALTLMVVPGTVLEQMTKEKIFTPVTSPVALLEEARTMLEHIETEERIVFRTNHASNYLPIAGTLPQDRERMLQTIERAILDSSFLRSESYRRL